MKKKFLTADLLIVGGGTAGCYAAITAARRAPEKQILIVEKANILRSGCLAAGVNALNAYIHEGLTARDYVDFVRWDAEKILREDLVRTMAEGFNEAAQDLEKMGLVILKDEKGRYAARGKQNIKINGENIKPVLAKEVGKYPNIRVLNHVNLTDLLTTEKASFRTGRQHSEGNESVFSEMQSTYAEETASLRTGDQSFAEKEAASAEETASPIGLSGASEPETKTEKKTASVSSDVGMRRVCGAVGLSIDGQTAYAIKAPAVLIATGGAAGLYRPNNPGFSRHKMWYPPFNTGAGYAMGIRAGAEMTSFEMRFVAQRCKDTIAPTGTIALGVGAREINAKGEIFEQKYGLSTSGRAYGATSETHEGRGPCYLRTEGISKEQDQDLLKAYLNMAPAQTLRWIESGRLPSIQNVEVEGTEPYIVGGHTGSGYWIDAGRRTTLPGLYAAGDVAGGSPKKFVTGAMAEGRIAAGTILGDLAATGKTGPEFLPEWEDLGAQTEAVFSDYEKHLQENLSAQTDAAIPDFEKHLQENLSAHTDAAIPNFKKHIQEHLQQKAQKPLFDVFALEEAMQKVMDEYAGGIRTGYRYNTGQLKIAREKIAQLTVLADTVTVEDPEDLYRVFELRDRLTVCRTLLSHMQERTETRWPGFGIHTDYPERDNNSLYFVNSVLKDGEIHVFRRPL